MVNNSIGQDQPLEITGYAAPDAEVDAFIDNAIATSTQSDSKGYYSIYIPPSVLSVGDHFVKTRYSLSSGQASDFSDSQAFNVSSLAYPKADLNGDGSITISDWSIFLYRWNSKDPTLRATLDINGDGKVDITDFSIFLSLIKF
ncbi:MAG: dockerin type I domain-containing protein [Patescibacteria group bacterium]|nr:dockerin type I domain-containing protein [Patescibacteria group bacterium]